MALKRIEILTQGESGSKMPLWERACFSCLSVIGHRGDIGCGAESVNVFYTLGLAAGDQPVGPGEDVCVCVEYMGRGPANCSVHGSKSQRNTDLAVETQKQQHDEEEDGPEGWQRHHGHSFRVRDEGQARTCREEHKGGGERGGGRS